ncbi:enoyl-CoA hydratase-related protein [Paenibacillus alkalitolerans]|uniref:enoyl-CoA hydratase-related protein n=1 Tax=Paenibacillus alkalitolerans TaxID=2799335 RepID=UPI0018F6BE2C|nr:enoyl-CoA hydratase-related protein [Paenibacillus alkalitolerans]
MRKPVLWEKHGHIGYIRLNRPDVMNALNYDMLAALGEIIGNMEQYRGDIRAVIVGGEGRAFCAGADLKERALLKERQVLRNVNKTKEVFTAIERLPQPTIAAINGYALGGGLELALSCDFRYAVREAKLGLTEVGLGIIPGAGGTQRLPRLIGPSKAKELILTGRKISAERALALGVLNGVAGDRQQLQELCEALAVDIATNAPLAVYQAKLAIDRGMNTDLQTGLEIEAEAYEAIISTKDRLEALKAFREKRAPRFTGE